jgi:hypothetical protein
MRVIKCIVSPAPVLVAVAVLLALMALVSADPQVVATLQFKTGTQFVDELSGQRVTLAEVSGLGLYEADTLVGLDDGGNVVQGTITLDGKTLAEALRDDVASAKEIVPGPSAALRYEYILSHPSIWQPTNSQ